MSCGMSFTFARGVEVAEPMEELVVRDLTAFCEDEQPLLDILLRPDVLNDTVEHMAARMASIEVDRVYVVLDGIIIPADQKGPFRGKGIKRRHDLPYIPQVEALSNPAVMTDVLENVGYWVEYDQP
jgi:hypothetical protein